MKRDLTGLVDGIRKDSAAFQERVVAALEAMKARRTGCGFRGARQGDQGD
jgi:hypothetical protein